jgi:hypothetical protein
MRQVPPGAAPRGLDRACGAASQSVALIVKALGLEAGFDPALFAGHSLRSGAATAAAKAGKSERSHMKQTGQRSVSVVRRYIRDAELFDPPVPDSKRLSSLDGPPCADELFYEARPSTVAHSRA